MPSQQKPVELPQQKLDGESGTSMKQKLSTVSKSKELQKSVHIDSEQRLPLPLNSKRRRPLRHTTPIQRFMYALALTYGIFESSVCRVIHSVDYNEVFAAVVRHSTMRIILALCAHYTLFANHFDVPKAFPNADIDCDVYMKAPPGVRLPAGRCFKLQKSLYGLKQAARLWNKLLSSYLVSLGMTQCLSDSCVFFKRSGAEFTIVAIYVDDILVATSSLEYMQFYTTQLHDRFKTTNLGPVWWICGMRVYVAEDRKTIQLSHAQYVDSIITAAQAHHLSNLPVPMHPQLILHKGMAPQNDSERACMQQTPYRTIVGMLLYLMVSSRPDIAYAVGTCARFMDCYGPKHWEAVLCILRYLKGAKDLRITYKADDTPIPIIYGYADADWATHDLDNRHSHTGYVFMLCGGPIAWKSKLQSTISLSSMDSEYYAMGDSAKEAVALRELFQELDFIPNVSKDDDKPRPTSIYSDNISAIRLSHNPVFHKRSKHIAIRHHFIRQLIDANIIAFEYISSADNLADLLTKPLIKSKFIQLRTPLIGKFGALLVVLPFTATRVSTPDIYCSIKF